MRRRRKRRRRRRNSLQLRLRLARQSHKRHDRVPIHDHSYGHTHTGQRTTDPPGTTSSWEFYQTLLEGIGERQVRLTYDDGFLEIMTLSLDHESYCSWIDRLIGTLTFELNIPIRSGGSTTLKRKLKRKGLEAGRVLLDPK